MEKKRTSLVAWGALLIGMLYMGIPLVATLIFSVSSKLHSVTAPTPISFSAYATIFNDPKFGAGLWFSLGAGLLTILISTVLLVPLIYWVQLRMPYLRSVIEFMTLLPIVIPAIVLVFGLLGQYRGTFLTNSDSGLYVLLTGSYVIIAFPYTYRPINTAFQAINVKVLTEAAQSLGSGWFTIIVRVILPNVWTGVLNAAFITLAIALGEFTISNALAQNTFSMYLFYMETKIYEPVAFTVVAFILTWFFIVVLQQVTKRPAQRATRERSAQLIGGAIGLPSASESE
ncbi:MAG TPA: ABC transporter permease subunit [Aggregatilineales bacterium]|nr:ABC transporter permease subunit [Aggregatilineales bacterium]